MLLLPSVEWRVLSLVGWPGSVVVFDSGKVQARYGRLQWCPLFIVCSGPTISSARAYISSTVWNSSNLLLTLRYNSKEQLLVAQLVVKFPALCLIKVHHRTLFTPRPHPHALFTPPQPVHTPTACPHSTPCSHPTACLLETILTIIVFYYK
jgi:hypothetical protein